MYGEERKTRILDFVNKHSRASVQELRHCFQASESTIRRDLKELEEARLLRRTHGGAVSLQGVTFEPTFREKEDKFRKEKDAIAKKAVEFIEEGDTILVDSGTTTFRLVKELKIFSRLTVLTNSILVAQELQDQPGIEVLVVGGTLRKETLALVGSFAEQVLNLVRVDKAFIGTNALDVEEGLTTPNLTEAATKRMMLKSAKQVILLTDHSKIGKVTFAKVAEVSQIDKCVIDDAVSESVIEKLGQLGVDVHIVHPLEEAK